MKGANESRAAGQRNWQMEWRQTPFAEELPAFQ
jgi:hypothetical protein